MIHKALLGSIERFLSVYIEHTGGQFPLWLSPVQVVLLPVSEKHAGAALEVKSVLESAGLRVELSASDESLGKRIRSAKLSKIPYLAVIGDKEIENKTLSLEGREGALGALPREDVVARLQSEVRKRQ